MSILMHGLNLFFPPHTHFPLSLSDPPPILAVTASHCVVLADPELVIQIRLGLFLLPNQL